MNGVLLMKLMVLCAVLVPADVQAAGQEIEQQIRDLAQDYADDPSLVRRVTFGIRVDDESWTVEAKPADGNSAATVSVNRGTPTVPAFVYSTDAATFFRVASGDLHALTTMVQARASDPTPMQLDTVNGFEMDEEGRNLFLSVSFHFFTTGLPETVPLAPSHALPAHGGEALPIYYAEGLRTSWYGIAPGQHINADARDQVNDFPSLFVILEAGSARARIGGRDVALEDNQAIFVPAGMSHEFWNPGDERGTFLLIMFGDNA